MEKAQQTGDVSKSFLTVLLIIAIVLSVAATWISLTSVQQIQILGEEKDSANVKFAVSAPVQPTSDSGSIRLNIR